MPSRNGLSDTINSSGESAPEEMRDEEERLAPISRFAEDDEQDSDEEVQAESERAHAASFLGHSEFQFGPNTS